MRSPLSLESFADWLGTMPPEQRYEYSDGRHCAICQYFDFLGLKYFYVGSQSWSDEELNKHPLPREMNTVAIHARPHTFGAAHQLARKLMAKP